MDWSFLKEDQCLRRNLMQNNFQLSELGSLPEMLQHISIIQQLQPSLTLKEYKLFLPEMIRNGYGQVAIFDNGRCIGISGYWINTKLYSGKYLEMDNVVVDENYRSKGIGKLLCDWCIAKAKEKKCKKVMLDAYLENEKAHLFYEREGFMKKGYHFIKSL